MAYNYTQIDGQRVQVDVANAFHQLNHAFKNAFGMTLHVSSGTRTSAEQKYFYDLYLSGKGNLALPPGKSNHEENGPVGPRALDVRDSGADAGVTVAGTKRANWLRANAPKYGFNPAGYGFSQVEPWHIEYTGAFTNTTNSTVNNDVKNQQNFLNVYRGEKLAVDGIKGNETTNAFKRYQEFLKHYGYTGAIDGDWGQGTQAAHAIFYGVITTTKLEVDKKLGPKTYFLLQKATGLTGKDADGVFGVGSIKALQRALKVEEDGKLGPITIKALQRLVGANEDGVWGEETTGKLQTYLNNGNKIVEPPKSSTPTIVVTPAVKRTATFPEAVEGWDSPRGRGKRTGGKITSFAVHHNASTNTSGIVEMMKASSEGVISTWVVGKAGEVYEMMIPENLPVTTAGNNNWTVSAEIVNTTMDPNWEVSEASLEATAKLIAWLQSMNGKKLGDILVDFTISRETVRGHKEYPGNATICPGPYVSARLDWLVERAKQIYQEKYVKVSPPPVVTLPPKEEVVENPVEVEVVEEKVEDKKHMNVSNIQAPDGNILGAIITSPKGRKITYSIFAGVALLVGATVVGYNEWVEGFEANLATFPLILNIAVTEITYLTPFMAGLAIANTQTTTQSKQQ